VKGYGIKCGAPGNLTSTWEFAEHSESIGKLVGTHREHGGITKMQEKSQPPFSKRRKLGFSRVIRKVTLSSPCLWASFHPLSPLSVVCAK